MNPSFSSSKRHILNPLSLSLLFSLQKRRYEANTFSLRKEGKEGGGGEKERKRREKVSGKILITNNALGYVWNFFLPFFCFFSFNASHNIANSSFFYQFFFFLFFFIFAKAVRGPLYAMKKDFSLILSPNILSPAYSFFILFFDINFPFVVQLCAI